MSNIGQIQIFTLHLNFVTTAGSSNQGRAGGGSSSEAAPVAEGSTKCEQIIKVEGLNSPTVVGIAFAAFFIGISLTGTIWYIHSCTGSYGILYFCFYSIINALCRVLLSHYVSNL